MASRPSQPALYEKMRTKAVDSPVGAASAVSSPASSASRSASAPPVLPKVDLHPIAVHSSPSDGNAGLGGGGAGSAGGAGASWLGPGRAIRLPTGYVMLGIGVAIMLLSIVYVLGHKRGASVARTEFEQVITRSTGGVNDPLTNLQPVIDTANRGTADGRRPATGGTSRSATGTVAGSGINSPQPANWGPVAPATDPRQKGMNYFILAETTETGAKALAEFCRTKGLETYVVSGKNQRRRVIAFPGFSRDQRSSPAVKALEAKIQSIGQQWKPMKGSGGDDLSGFYPSLYNG